MNQIDTDYTLGLPTELWSLIVAQMDQKAIVKCLRVCKAWSVMIPEFVNRWDIRELKLKQSATLENVCNTFKSLRELNCNLMFLDNLNSGIPSEKFYFCSVNFSCTTYQFAIVEYSSCLLSSVQCITAATFASEIFATFAIFNAYQPIHHLYHFATDSTSFAFYS